MPKINRGVIAAIVALLVFTGCAGGPATDSPAAPQTQVEQPTDAPTPEPEPLVAETPSIDPDEAAYIEYVRGKLRPNNVVPDATDEQLVAAGLEGCALFDAGVDPDDLSVIEGEERDSGGYFEDSSVIVTAARMILCSPSQ